MASTECELVSTNNFALRQVLGQVSAGCGSNHRKSVHFWVGRISDGSIIFGLIRGKSNDLAKTWAVLTSAAVASTYNSSVGHAGQL